MLYSYFLNEMNVFLSIILDCVHSVAKGEGVGRR